MTSEWQNYDFGANWSKVFPLLQTRAASKLFQQAHIVSQDRYLPEEQTKYDHKKAPAALLCWTEDYDRLYNTTIWEHEVKDRKSTIAKQWWRQLDQIETEIELSGDVPDSYDALRSKIMQRLGWDFKTNPNHLFHYVPLHSSHSWNPFVSLYLARKLMPEHKWIIAKGDGHTTVISISKKLVFDMVHWGIDQRLEDHTLKRKYTSPDPSLGGIQAVEDSGYLRGEYCLLNSSEDCLMWREDPELFL